MDNIFIFRKNTHNIQNVHVISKKNKKIVRDGQETVKVRTSSPWEN